MVADPAVSFVPPPYPYDRLRALERQADSLSGGVVDCSIGTPCDAVPEVAIRAASAALADSMGYPASAGSPALREAAAAWIDRRFGVAVDAENVGACVGTKELVVTLPHLLRLRNPQRDTVLYPAISYPSYEMGAFLAGCRAVPVALDSQWHLDLARVSAADAERALVLWVNEPGNPTSSVATRAQLVEIAAWARERGIVVASDECYAEFAPEPATILAAGLDGVLAMHSVSKRSNLAGMRVGFYAGDADLVSYLVETRKHAGLMAPVPMQAAGGRRARRRRSRGGATRPATPNAARSRIDALAPLGLVHDGGPCSFYLWLRRDDGADDGWEIAAQLAQTAGLLVAPGDLYGPAGADHVRLALVQPNDRFELAFDRLRAPRADPQGAR